MLFVRKMQIFYVDDVEAGTECATESMFMYYVNDGVYGSFNCILFDHMPVEASLLEVNISAA